MSRTPYVGVVIAMAAAACTAPVNGTPEGIARDAGELPGEDASDPSITGDDAGSATSADSGAADARADVEQLDAGEAYDVVTVPQEAGSTGDGAPPPSGFTWYCEAQKASSNQFAYPFCKATVRTVCGTYSGSDASVDDAGSWTCPVSETAPCGGPCSVYIDVGGPSYWYSGVAVHP